VGQVANLSYIVPGLFDSSVGESQIKCTIGLDFAQVYTYNALGGHLQSLRTPRKDYTVLRFGIHPFVWTSVWNGESSSLIERAIDLGFTAMDVPVRLLDEEGIRKTKEWIISSGIHPVGVLALGRDYDFTSQQEETRRKAIDYLKKMIVTTHNIGANILGGVLYSPLGKLVGRGPDEAEIARSVEALKESARFAKNYEVTLALEPVCRYETYMINTATQAVSAAERIGESNVGILLDTYQMNIEEKDFYRTIVECRDHLVHLHLCENDRGIPGTGLVRWDDVFRALKEIDYDGVATIESFVSAVPEIAASTCVWRSLAPDGDTLAKEGLGFLKSMARKHGIEFESALS
jgi:D-psicose/D-tagatose/L-ribulose 3-epimerase